MSGNGQSPDLSGAIPINIKFGPEPKIIKSGPTVTYWLANHEVTYNVPPTDLLNSALASKPPEPVPFILAMWALTSIGFGSMKRELANANERIEKLEALLKTKEDTCNDESNDEDEA